MTEENEMKLIRKLQNTLKNRANQKDYQEKLRLLEGIPIKSKVKITTKEEYEAFRKHINDTYQEIIKNIKVDKKND